jgi:hypothetical protein
MLVLNGRLRGMGWKKKKLPIRAARIFLTHLV